MVNNLNQKNNIFKILNKCREHNFFSCGFNITIISNEIIKLCKNYAKQITVYSSENIEKNEADKLWDLGGDSIFIDNPTSYKNVL